MKNIINISLLISIITTTNLFAQNYSVENIDFMSGDIKIAASLHIPNEGTNFPAVVFIHGSGNSDRTNVWNKAYAEELASKGILVLFPDKRGTGESEGDWQNSTLTELASDAVAAVNYLVTLNDVDTSRIVLIGFSQGGQVAPVAAYKSKHVDLVIDIVGSVYQLKDIITDEIFSRAEKENLSPEQTNEVMRLNDLGFEFVDDEAKWNNYYNKLVELKSSDIGGTDVVSGFPDKRDIWVWNWLRLNQSFAAIDYWKQIDIPMLFIYSGNDHLTNVKRNIDIVFNELKPLDKNFTIHFYNPNGHGIFRDDLNEFIVRWIKDNGKK